MYTATRFHGWTTDDLLRERERLKRETFRALDPCQEDVICTGRLNQLGGDMAEVECELRLRGVQVDRVRGPSIG